MKDIGHYLATHCCQGHGDQPNCPMLYIHRGEDGARDQQTNRKMSKYAVYCRRDGLRSICGNLASWTGITPKWCPTRQKMEGEQ